MRDEQTVLKANQIRKGTSPIAINGGNTIAVPSKWKLGRGWLN